MPQIDFDLRQLEIFCKIVELESFSKAARTVFLAQASVSERIATLENMVGTRLLDRMGRQVVPTTAGKILYRHALGLLEMKKSACVEIEDFLGIRKGTVNIGASTVPGEYIVPKIIGTFNKQYPVILINIIIEDTGKIAQKVLSGELEAGIVGSKSTNKNLVYKKLWKDELVPAITARHKWGGKKHVSIEDLCEEPFILRQKGSGTLKIINQYLKSVSKSLDSLNTIALFGSSTAIKEAVKAGLGISILSLRTLQTEIETGILKTLKIKNMTMERNFYLVQDKRRNVSPACRALLDFFSTSLTFLP